MSDFIKTVVALAAIAVITSCASSESPSSLMGNTNWLTTCDEDDDCDDDLSCSCGVCTRECTSTADCSELGGSVCDVESEALASACGSSIAMSVCLPQCRNDNDCRGGLECVAEHCLPAEVVAASPGGDGDGDGGASIGCGPNGAFISANVAPDEECILNAEGSAQLPIGMFDMSSGFNEGDDSNCNTGYRVNLLAYSCLQGANDTLQLHSAEILLKVPSGEAILFDRLDPPLPNPFLVVGNSTIFPMRDDAPSSGVITVEAIPAEYAAQLDDFDGQQVHAEIRVYGTTVGDSDVDLNPFLYPIELCDGCLTLCAAAISAEATLDEIYGEGTCRDNAGADGRRCIDTSCVDPR